MGLLAVIRRLKPRRFDPGRALPFVLLTVFAVVLVYYTAPRPRSFFLDLTTDILRVRTDTDTQIAWEFGALTLCLPRHLLDAEPADAGPARHCNAAHFAEIALSDVVIDWPPEVDLVLRANADASLGILATPPADTRLAIGGVALVPGSLLRVGQQALAQHGGLGITGQFRAGQTAANGTRALLRAGRFETRERFWFRDAARMVDSGTFSLGDVVSITTDGDAPPLSAYAFVNVIPTDSGASLRATVTVEEGPGRLRLERERARATDLEPSWAARLASDPLAVGLATILSLFGATMAVLGAFFGSGRRR